jgi:hypothetical protein
MRKVRFLKVSGAVKDPDPANIAQARQLTGLKEKCRTCPRRS